MCVAVCVDMCSNMCVDMPSRRHSRAEQHGQHTCSSHILTHVSTHANTHVSTHANTHVRAQHPWGGLAGLTRSRVGHNYICHVDHDYIGHNYIGHNYIGHKYTGGSAGLTCVRVDNALEKVRQQHAVQARVHARRACTARAYIFLCACI